MKGGEGEEIAYHLYFILWADMDLGEEYNLTTG